MGSNITFEDLLNLGKCLVIPTTVIQELDNNKKTIGIAGYNARQTLQKLSKTKFSIAKNATDLKKILTNKKDPVKCIILADEFYITEENIGKKNDDLIVDAAMALKDQVRGKESKVILLSGDFCVQLKAKMNDLDTEEVKLVDDEKALFRIGVEPLSLDEEDLADLDIAPFKIEKFFDKFKSGYFHINERFYGFCDKDRNLVRINKLDSVRGFGKIKGQDLLQKLALHALMESNNVLVTLAGKAGSGKTLLALSAAMDFVLSQKQVSKIIVLKSIVPMGGSSSLGALPGSLTEKIAPWGASIFDNLKEIMPNELDADAFIESGALEILPLEHVRGRSLTDCIVILDEAQNLTPLEMKTVATRIGRNCRLFVTGDISQIDNQKLSPSNNGFTALVNATKESTLAKHITLSQCKRSEFASQIADLI